MMAKYTISKSATNANRNAAERIGGDVPRGGPPAWAVAALIGFLIGAVYGPSINVPFVFDDRDTVLGNESILKLWPLVGHNGLGPLMAPPEFPTSGRPMVNLSFAINYYFGGYDTVGYHAVNIVMHFLSAMLVWAIANRTLRMPCFGGRFEQSAGWLALAVALLWALHPLQTESVIYVTQRTELMMAVCYLTTLYCSLRYWAAAANAVDDGAALGLGASPIRSGGRIWLVLAFLVCLIGMGSKEVMVSAPLIVLLYERTFVRGTLGNVLRRSWPLYALLFSTWGWLLRLNLGKPHSDSTGFALGVTGPEWWMTQSKVFFFYLKMVLWPWPLLFHYHMPYLKTLAESWMYVLPLLLLGLATAYALWRNRPIGFLGTWAFAVLSPTFVIPIVTEIAAERRMYLPLAPIIAAVVVGSYLLAMAIVDWRRGSQPEADKSRRSLVAIGVPTAILAVVFCVVCSARLGAYGSELNLWLEVLQAQPDNPMAHQAIGFYYAQAGDDDTAIEHYQRAIELNPDAAHVHYLLASLYLKHGKYDDAIYHFQESVRVVPTSVAVARSFGGRVLHGWPE